MKKTSPNIASFSHIDLPDINVWLALVDETHGHHPAAKDYWHAMSSPAIAFCRVTMLGFLRLSTRSRVLSKPLSPREAWDTYRQFLALPLIHFLPEPPSVESRFAALTAGTLLPHHLWTGAYLAAFALAEGCRIIPFDTDFQRFPSLDFLQLIP